MPVLVQVVCTRGQSMRVAVAKHAKLKDHDLKVTQQKKQGRSRGWTKVRSTVPGRHGAINLEWDADTSVLISRVVTRGKGKPNHIIGDFVDFLIRRFRSRIQTINVIPRD